MRLILASTSPRRRELLTAAGYEFDVIRPHDEAETGLCSNCGPAELVVQLAVAKAADVVRQLEGVGSGQWAGGSEKGTGDKGQETAERNSPSRRLVVENNRKLAESQRLARRSTTASNPTAGSLAPPCNPQSAICNPNSLLVLAADTVAECDGHILGKPKDEEHARQMLELLSGREHRVYTGVCLWLIGERAGRSGRQETGNRGQETGDRRQETGDRNSPSRRLVVENNRDLAASQRLAGHRTGAPDPIKTGGAVAGIEHSTSVAVTTLRMDNLAEQQLDEYLVSDQWEGKAGAFGYQDRLGWVHITEGSESNVVGLPMELVEQMLRKFGF